MSGVLLGTILALIYFFKSSNNRNRKGYVGRGMQMVVFSAGIFFAIIIAVLAVICFSNEADILGIILLVFDAAVIGAWYVCA